jgi:hypothetical protein
MLIVKVKKFGVGWSNSLRLAADIDRAGSARGTLPQA